MSQRRAIAESILGVPLEDGQYAPCPGRQFHTTKNGRRDFRVCLDGAPTGSCFHGGCLGEVDAFNLRLRREIWFAEHGTAPAPKSWGEGVSAEPQAERKARPDLDREKLMAFIHGVPEIDAPWLRKRSPIDPRGMQPGAFLDALYEPGECVLIFTSQMSQGDFGWCAGRGGFRLSQQRGVKGVPSRLPAEAPDGVWYLVQPVTGKWAINAKGSAEGQPAKYTRRSEVNVTAWRYYVLESDELEPALWLRALVALALPIAAIYTSGGRSIHALIKMPVEAKAVWDAVRKQLLQLVCPLGADPAALTAVRLSRLPGCRRGGKMQELLYLDPKAEQTHEQLMLKREVRA